jgi:hypothetical protein
MAIEQTPTKSAGTPVDGFRDPLLQASFDRPEQRKDKEYGRTLLARIYREQNNNSSTMFYGARNIRWMEVWDWLMGRQNMKEFLDYVGVEGNLAYSNVDYTQNRIGPQFVETLVNSMAADEEYARVTAIDESSQKEKDQEKKDALFRMHNADVINQLQTKAGIHLEPPNAYVPDDELSAEVHFELEHRLPKEIDFEKKIKKIQDDNEYEILKRRIYRYLIGINCGCTKVEKGENGFVGIRTCLPPNLIYNFFITESGKMELSYIGELYNLKVREVRKKYGKTPYRPDGLTEKEIFEIAKNANQYNNSGRFYYYWNDNYLYATDRPYDDYSVQVFDCEIKVFDSDYYVNKIDSFGKENIQPKKGIPQPTSEKSTVIKRDKYTVYRGVWAVKANTMLYWGLPDVVIKPYMDISESLFSYSIQIPNNDGDYVPSLFERALSPLRRLQLAELKMKQLIAEMVPAGYSVDVETIRDVDIGGGKSIGYQKVIEIRNQKGVVFWSSAGLDPNRRNDRPPIEELANAGSVPQLNELANIIEQANREIRSVLGVPQYRDGSDLPPRMGQAVVENQETNSNNVTGFINASFRQLMQETLYKCCIIKWDEAVIKESQDDLLDTIFEIKVEMRPTAYEKQLTEQQITVGMQEGLLDFKDAFYIRNIKNFKVQQLYLANLTEKRKKEASQAQATNVQQTAAVQQQSNEQAANNKANELMLAHKLKMEELAETQRGQKETGLLTGILAILAKTGGQVPDVLQPITQQVFQNVSIGMVLENAQTKMGLHDAVQDSQAQMQQDSAQQQQLPPGQQAAPQPSPDQSPMPQQ